MIRETYENGTLVERWDSRERVRTRHLRVDCDLRTVAA